MSKAHRFIFGKDNNVMRKITNNQRFLLILIGKCKHDRQVLTLENLD